MSTSKQFIIPIFIPHEGCKNDCVFCNQRSISGSNHVPSDEDIIKIVENFLCYVDDRYCEIAFYGGSFTGLPYEIQENYLKIVQKYIKPGDKDIGVDSIRVSTRPDYIDQRILSLLKNYNVKTIELGAQSMDDFVLNSSNRGHTSKDTEMASELIKKNGFQLGLQTMTGLPGSSLDKELKTAERIVELAPDMVRIYPTLVIKGTLLEHLYKENKYRPPELEEAVNTCARLLDIYENNNIEVIRVGLQASDNISAGGDIVAGPYHPAFGQMVNSHRFLNKFRAILSKMDLKGIDTYELSVSKSRLSDAIGQKRCNIRALEAEFGIKIIISEATNLPK
ncbi:MAG: radical SAM protein [Clostridiales bacterium]|jgi:radical SAM enzyme (TIGR01210 family)|nr:radical SAM protein [Clostridiales bacterium]